MNKCKIRGDDFIAFLFKTIVAQISSKENNEFVIISEDGKIKCSQLEDLRVKLR